MIGILENSTCKRIALPVWKFILLIMLKIRENTDMSFGLAKSSSWKGRQTLLYSEYFWGCLVVLLSSQMLITLLKFGSHAFNQSNSCSRVHKKDFNRVTHWFIQERMPLPPLKRLVTFKWVPPSQPTPELLSNTLIPNENPEVSWAQDWQKWMVALNVLRPRVPLNQKDEVQPYMHGT